MSVVSSVVDDKQR